MTYLWIRSARAGERLLEHVLGSIVSERGGEEPDDLFAGQIAHALETWEEPGGGGAVAAAQLARLSGACSLFTALGSDELGRRARAELSRLAVEVRAIPEVEPTRR